MTPSEYGKSNLTRLPLFNRSETPRTIAPRLTGKYNINVYFKADSLFKLHIRHATKTVPLLEIPGIIVIASKRPMIIASFKVISLSSLLPFIFLTRNRAKAVIKKAKPRKWILLNLFSIKS